MTCDIQFFSCKDPAETVPLTFDFTDALPDGVTLASIVSTTFAVCAGVDAGPALVVGAFSISGGSMVLVGVSGGLDGVNYEFKVTCQTSNSQLILTLSAILPVRA